MSDDQRMETAAEIRAGMRHDLASLRAENAHLRAENERLRGENARLGLAFHKAINSPLGVVPGGFEDFYDPEM